MPTPAPGKISPIQTRRLKVIAASLSALLGLALIAISRGNIMSTLEAANSGVSGDAGQQAYDANFLKILSEPSQPGLAPGVSGLRKVVVQDLALRNAEPSSTQGQEGKYELTLDISQQVLNLDVPVDEGYGNPEDAGEAPLYPSFSQATLGENFTPAAALALKAKQFDDGLYAAVELAADAGLDRFPGRKGFLLNLLKGLSAENNRSAAAFLTAAAHLGGQEPAVGADVAHDAQVLQQQFLGDELRSKPLGFYTWNQSLIQIFQRDRMLQTPLDKPVALPLATALAHNPGLLMAYAASLTLNERLTNPLAGDDLRPAAMVLRDGHTPSFAVHPALFPASQAQETNLMKKLYGARPIPEGFNLADEMVKRLRAGELNLKPRTNSGWYDYQTYALEPLAIPERMPEAQRLQFDESYRHELVGLFKALLALTRETHVKQLEFPKLGSARRMPHLEPTRISPDLSLEPLPTFYLRRARSYQFVRRVLEQSFGPEALPKMHRLTATGPVNLSLASELTLMEALFQGAYLRSCDEIGMRPEPGPASPTDAHLDRALLGAWLESIPKDPDLGKDIRMMVPVFYDIQRKKTKVWAVLGIASKPLNISYVHPPTVKEVRGPGGARVNPGDAYLEFVNQNTHLTYIVSAEIYVTHLLNRTEFRQLCDQKKTFKAIVESLN